MEGSTPILVVFRVVGISDEFFELDLGVSDVDAMVLRVTPEEEVLTLEISTSDESSDALHS